MPITCALHFSGKPEGLPQFFASDKPAKRLLNLHLSGEPRRVGVRNEEHGDSRPFGQLKLQLEVTDRSVAEKADVALKVFELSQSLPEKWIKSD